jgi:putative ABC transport system substrate-binding protein
MRRTWPALAAVLLGALVAPAAPGPAARPSRVRALLSQDSEPYRRALAGFRGALAGSGLAVEIEVHALDARAPSAGDAAPLDLILALGSAATTAAAARTPRVPVVSGLVLRISEIERAPNVTGVFLEFPVEVEFHWMAKLLPRQRRVGVLYGAAENVHKIDAAIPAATALALELHPRRVEAPSQIPASLASLGGSVDVLWGVADSIVLTPETAKPILLFSLRHRIPFVGLSLPWVKAGALYALDRDYEDVGRQCGEIAARLLRGEPPSAIPPVPPRRVEYFVNRRTAEQLRIELAPDVLRGAREVVE